MARFEYTDYQQAGGRWAGDYSNRDSLLPGGVTVNPAAVTASATSGKRFLPGGTLLGRTETERQADAPFGLYANGDTDVYLTFNDVADLDSVPHVAVYRHGRVVYPEYLPDTSKVAATLAKIAELYTVTKGRN